MVHYRTTFWIDDLVIGLRLPSSRPVRFARAIWIFCQLAIVPTLPSELNRPTGWCRDLEPREFAIMLSSLNLAAQGGIRACVIYASRVRIIYCRPFRGATGTTATLSANGLHHFRLSVGDKGAARAGKPISHSPTTL